MMNETADNPRHDEFLRLYAKAQSVLRCYVYGHMPDSHRAEDVLQETALVLWRKFETFRPESSFSAWAIGIARNLIRNERRKAARSKEVLTDDMETQFEAAVLETVPETDERRAFLDPCLKRLPRRAFDAVRMNYFMKITVERIAKTQGSTANAVRNLLYRTRLILSECMEEAARLSGEAT